MYFLVIIYLSDKTTTIFCLHFTCSYSLSKRYQGCWPAAANQVILFSTPSYRAFIPHWSRPNPRIWLKKVVHRCSYMYVHAMQRRFDNCKLTLKICSLPARYIGMGFYSGLRKRSMIFAVPPVIEHPLTFEASTWEKNLLSVLLFICFSKIKWDLEMQIEDYCLRTNEERDAYLNWRKAERVTEIDR